MEVKNTIGRRKTAIARVYLKPGNGNIIVNNKDYEEYFPTTTMQYIVNQPLELTNCTDKYDVKANLNGGGVKGQAEALRLAISRAIILYDNELRPALKEKGLLSRDSRMVERKTTGLI